MWILLLLLQCWRYDVDDDAACSFSTLTLLCEPGAARPMSESLLSPTPAADSDICSSQFEYISAFCNFCCLTYNAMRCTVVCADACVSGYLLSVIARNGCRDEEDQGQGGLMMLTRCRLCTNAKDIRNRPMWRTLVLVSVSTTDMRRVRRTTNGD